MAGIEEVGIREGYYDVRIHGDFYGTIYDKFTELTGDDITFTDDEKKKLLYLLI